MKNIITTIPKGRFKTWELAERVCRQCDGETIHQGQPWFWTIRIARPPKQEMIGAVCFMIYNARIRGYFDIVDVDDVTNWAFHTPTKAGKVIVMANWHPVHDGIEMTGFQGWRYTALRP